MKINVDLHIHSYFSDGSFSPEEIIKRAVEKKLKVISITDHDNIDSLKIANSIAKKYDLEFINGIEFSANIGKNDVHILGYFLNLEDKIFIERLEKLLKSRSERNKKIIEKLNINGIIINEEEVKKYAKGRILGRIHFAKALIEKNVVSSVKEAFDKFLSANACAFVERVDCDPIEIVKYLKENGAFISLAHPKLISKDDNFTINLVEKLKNYGLDALEINYPNFTKEDIAKYKTWAKKYNLFLTGGSDFHGDNRPNIDIACAGITYEQLEKIKNYMFN